MVHTEADFEKLSWHDCHIWGFELRAGDPTIGDWTSEIAFDLDFIVEWVPDNDVGYQFRLAPATLVFHGVTDPRVDIDWGRAGHQAAVHPASIGSVERELHARQKVYLDRSYFRWTIQLNWPASSEIAFGAVGFTQTLRGEPVLSDEQCLSWKERLGFARAEGV
jgi:hypothetical protein